MGAVHRFENGWASRPWGFDSLSFRSLSGVVELARRAVVTREIAGSIPAAGVRTHIMPPWSNGMTPGSQPGSAGSTPAGGARSTGCRGAGHPADFGRRRPQVRFLPARSVRRRAVEERLSSRAS